MCKLSKNYNKKKLHCQKCDIVDEKNAEVSLKLLDQFSTCSPLAKGYKLKDVRKSYRFQTRSFF